MGSASAWAAATTRHYHAFVVSAGGKFLVRQRAPGAVNAGLWEFPNVEVAGPDASANESMATVLNSASPSPQRLTTVRHSITRYRITQEVFSVRLRRGRSAYPSDGEWVDANQLRALPFTSAHRKVIRLLEL